ncbi:penicillin-binding protein [Priestia filamentosa]|uniref:transglycosylase domain-containing protein n=1 Tax=Priestia filamentosa TaxID=1402861 RepID=UPI001FB1FCEB|nr:transglycosylase domain-containing protein [Priestia filamentosa]MED3725628.1 transglycosylase domain-containing protein [Priestia filamentosa]UOE61130.1 penicillin-binding protein [Priestia filamentosa]
MWEKWKTKLKELLASLKDGQSSTYIKRGKLASLVIYNIVIIGFVFLLIIGSFAFGAGSGYFASLIKDESPPSKKEMSDALTNYSETSEIYFANNVPLGKLRSNLERDEVKLENVSPHLVNALISTEDEYFYKHDGVVPKAVLRALYQDVSNSATRTGGSTLTQQLIKNQMLTNEVSFTRKANEILLALRVENYFSKEEILEAYLNVAYFGRNSAGSNIAGVQTAAQGLFGRDAKDLTLEQAAFIAGLPQSPSRYTPFTQAGQLKEDLSPGVKRMKTVLFRMKRAGYITKQEYEQAVNYDITKDFKTSSPSVVEKYPWLNFEVEKRVRKILAEQLANKAGISTEKLYGDKALLQQYTEQADLNMRQNGYHIHTTIHKDIYDAMENVTKNFNGFNNYVKVNTGSVMIDNKSGAIISFVGGRDYQSSQYNYGTSVEKPNGSTMKPLLVYAPAIQNGLISANSMISNSAFTWGNWSPKNAGKNYTAPVTVRKALTYSYNIPAARVYKMNKGNNPVSYLEKMGFTSLQPGDYEHASLALGAMDQGVTVEENVNAYTTFANKGQFKDAYLIEKIETRDGKVLYQHETKPTTVFSTNTSSQMISMMRDVVQTGTAARVRNYLQFNSDLVGKTGTTQNENDLWFVASNPNVTFGTWMGRLNSPQSSAKPGDHLRLWAQYMNAAYRVEPSFIAPSERFQP